MGKVAVYIPSTKLYISIQKYLFSKGIYWAHERTPRVLETMEYRKEGHCMNVTNMTGGILYCSREWYRKTGTR